MYWACQLAGWLPYAALNSVYAVGVLHGGAPAVVFCLWLSAVGLALSHALRNQIRARGWAGLPLLGLAPRLLATGAVLGLLCNAIVTLPPLLLGYESSRRVTASGLVLYSVNLAIVFTAWQLIYFGVKFMQRSRRAELEHWQLEAAARAADLRALKAQLNPHFLFNSLNNVRALIAEDPQRAQAMVTRLANLLRYSLASATAETVPLQQELEIVGDYLELEGARLEERLRVRMDVAPECLPLPVPVMLVQSLVENGIKHGIARLPRGGQIEISARLDGPAMRLEVSNTHGPEADRVSDRPAGSGTGLANAAERLRLLFGEQASLQLDRSARELTTARVRIPTHR